MADGGFILKFNGKEVARGLKLSFDHDNWQWCIDDYDWQPFPKGIKQITIEFDPGD
jgi:hypothetical protein